MNESFWYLTAEPQSTRVRDAMRHAEDAPSSASMKPAKRTKTLTTDQKRRIKRSAIDGDEHREASVKEAAYGEGSSLPVIPTHKLPFISEEHARPRTFLQNLLEQAGVPQSPPPGGFDEPFQQEIHQRREHERKIRRQRAEMPDREKTPEGRGVDRLADMIGEHSTEREVRDARPPNETHDESKMRWFTDRWNKTFEPIGLNDEGKARSRRNTRARWEKTMGPAACDHPNCPPWEHHETGYRPKYSVKTATVLNTQIERLNGGDRIRTPTGQSVTVKKIRPHETDSTLMYLDTDMGTSTVKRGTDFQTVPYNAQQQELPDTGNPMAGGNSAQLPGQGRTPGGPGSGGGQPTTLSTTCPNCGNANTLHLKGNAYICAVCGYSVAAGGTPGGLMFTDQPKGVSAPRRKPGEVPRAHVWASKYVTTGDETQIARRARQVLGGEE